MLGVRLLERTTRVVRPTPAGAGYFDRCTRILAELEEANAAVSDLGMTPRGRLRIATPSLFGQSVLADVAASFTLAYPEVEIDIVASDRRVNLVDEGFDVGVMFAAAGEDSSLVARKLKGGGLTCCATPAYLDAHGTPKKPEDLTAHACIVNRELAVSEYQPARWTFERGADVRRVDVRGQLTINSMPMVYAAVRAGAGIAAVPTFLCGEQLRAGTLVSLLSDWVIDRKDMLIVYPTRRHLSPGVRLFVDALVTEFDKRTYASDAASASKGKKKAPRARRR